jgi:hypothetical protein
MTIFAPTRAFVSVDLPAFGRPTKQQKPDRNPTWSILASPNHQVLDDRMT